MESLIESQTNICESCEKNDDFGWCIGKLNGLNNKYSCPLYEPTEREDKRNATKDL